MKNIDNINPQLLVIEDFNIDDGIKYSILPGVYEGENYFFISRENRIDGLNFYNKLNISLDIIITDEASYNRLVNKFLEVKTQKELTNNDI